MADKEMPDTIMSEPAAAASSQRLLPEATAQERLLRAVTEMMAVGTADRIHEPDLTNLYLEGERSELQDLFAQIDRNIEAAQGHLQRIADRA